MEYFSYLARNDDSIVHGTVPHDIKVKRKIVVRQNIPELSKGTPFNLGMATLQPSRDTPGSLAYYH